MTYSAIEKLRAVERELSYRRRVYGGRVALGKMSQREMTYQLRIFEAIASDYRAKAESERLLR